jgi:hypothetical protein
MILNIQLAAQEQSRLEKIMAVLHFENSNQALRALINERFEGLPAVKLLTERNGEMVTRRVSHKAELEQIVQTKVVQRTF